MGIQGLLPLLKSIHKPTHLRNFAGQTLGVDAYGWLHRGTVACAAELAEGKPTRKHIEFALHRVRMLIHFGVTPYIVFDGDYLPSKAHTEKERAARRKESKRVGLELLRMGRPSQAHLELQKAVDVTPLMARELIEELKLLNVQYIVAPYEADSQLAYLEKKGVISGVLSEDSDLLVFGVKCLLTKLDQYGECVMINREDFTACKDISLVDWTDKEFRIMAMLTGCDYLPGINNMGLKTAYRLVRKHKTVEKVIRAVQFEGKMRIPVGYLEAFANAERTFVHPWAYCPDSRCLQHLSPLPRSLSVDSMPYIGKEVEPELATGVASGDLDPNTKQPIVLPNRFHQRARQSRIIVQTPNEKHGKPITDFFKSRQPLAELDPNSLETFTPSPSQQQLRVSQQNRSWSAVSSSAPPASRRVSSAPVRHAASPKRQRLCSDVPVPLNKSVSRLSTDSAIATAMSAPPTTSRFFGKPSTQASPSLRKKSSQKQEEFDLWSDDSVAEAVASATATPVLAQSASVSSPRKRKKISVLIDPDASLVDNSLGDVSQASVFTATPDSQPSVRNDSPDTSFNSTESPPPQLPSIFSKGVRAGLSTLRFEGYLSTSTMGTKSAPVSRIPQRPERLASRRSPPMALNDVVPNSSPPGPVETTFRSDVAEPDEDSINDEEWHSIERLSAQALTTSKGSEDMLIPNSPEEGQARPTLELSKYLFSG